MKMYLNKNQKVALNWSQDIDEGKLQETFTGIYMPTDTPLVAGDWVTIKPVGTHLIVFKKKKRGI